jgi:transcription antitermination factor NusG
LFWAVAQTHPNAAGIACVNLKRQGFTHYNPLMKERIKGRATFRSVQLFSNYIFVAIENQWRAVPSTKGILDLLMLEHEKPAFVSEDYITGLRAREDKDGLIVLGQSKFKHGSKVQVKAGPFAFQNGLFDGVSSHDRVFILLSMLGTQRRVELSEDNLVAV